MLSFLDLPTELHIAIIETLPLQALASFRGVSQYLCELCTPQLWKRLLPNKHLTEEETSYRTGMRRNAVTHLIVKNLSNTLDHVLGVLVPQIRHQHSHLNCIPALINTPGLMTEVNRLDLYSTYNLWMGEFGMADLTPLAAKTVRSTGDSRLLDVLANHYLLNYNDLFSAVSKYSYEYPAVGLTLHHYCCKVPPADPRAKYHTAPLRWLIDTMDLQVLRAKILQPQQTSVRSGVTVAIDSMFALLAARPNAGSALAVEELELLVAKFTETGNVIPAARPALESAFYAARKVAARNLSQPKRIEAYLARVCASWNHFPAVQMASPIERSSPLALLFELPLAVMIDPSHLAGARRMIGFGVEPIAHLVSSPTISDSEAATRIGLFQETLRHPGFQSVDALLYVAISLGRWKCFEIIYYWGQSEVVTPGAILCDRLFTKILQGDVSEEEKADILVTVSHLKTLVGQTVFDSTYASYTPVERQVLQPWTGV
jgi:hypothetical protein